MINKIIVVSLFWNREEKRVWMRCQLWGWGILGVQGARHPGELAGSRSNRHTILPERPEPGRFVQTRSSSDFTLPSIIRRWEGFLLSGLRLWKVMLCSDKHIFSTLFITLLCAMGIWWVHNAFICAIIFNFHILCFDSTYGFWVLWRLHIQSASGVMGLMWFMLLDNVVLVKEDNCWGKNTERGARGRSQSLGVTLQTEMVRLETQVLVFLNCPKTFTSREVWLLEGFPTRLSLAVGSSIHYTSVDRHSCGLCLKQQQGVPFLSYPHCWRLLRAPVMEEQATGLFMSGGSMRKGGLWE